MKMTIMTLKGFTFKDYIGLLFGILILFMQPLKLINPMFSYIDEIIMLTIFICYILRFIIKKQISRSELKIILLYFIFVIVAVYGNVKSKYLISINSIFLDIFSFSKFFLTLICSISFCKTMKNNKKIMKILAFIVQINLIVSFPLAILNQFVDLGMRDGIRYGIFCFKYIYDTAAIFSWYCLMYLIVLSIDLLNGIDNRKKFFIILNMIVWLFTARSRAFAFIATYLIIMFLVYFFNKKKLKIKLKLKYFIILGCFGVIIAWKQIVFYFTSSREARYILMHVGLNLCSNFMPFGAGFGTFGTYAAQKYYSPVYNDMGLNSIYGFTADNPLYLTDNFWPAILGETGMIGCIIFIILLFYSFRYLYKKLAFNNLSKGIVIFFIATVLMSSVATTIFTQNVTTGELFLLCMIPGILMEEDSYEKNKY